MINVEGEKLTERRLLEKTNSEFLKHLKKKNEIGQETSGTSVF